MLEFYVGGYAVPGQPGVLKCGFDGAGMTVIDSNDELQNPSWVLQHPEKKVLYAVEELSPEGTLAALGEAEGHMRVLARVTTRGADPCHIALSPDGRFLFVSNYSGGSLAVYALDENGLPVRMTDFVVHHMDDVRRDGAHVYVCDLGLDRVFIYGWNREEGRLVAEGRSIGFPEGSGPRHLAFAGDGERLYVLCELDATVHMFRRQSDGDWQRAQVVSTVPEGADGFEAYSWSAGAAIRFADAHTLCTSTRGHDSLALFRVLPDGSLADRRVLSSCGKTPRDFMPAGPWLLAANQDSDCVRALRCDGAGEESGPGLSAIRPTCLCLAR